jgi:hypothetical protein
MMRGCEVEMGRTFLPITLGISAKGSDLSDLESDLESEEEM